MVDLPAPFWPISACTSPAATLRLALRNAGTPPKLMPMSCISSSGERVRGECGVCVPYSVTGVLLMRVLLHVLPHALHELHALHTLGSASRCGRSFGLHAGGVVEPCYAA